MHKNIFQKTRYLTCDMQVEHGGLWAQAVLPGSSHSVDSHSFVDVFDPILDGAHVGICKSVAISKVQSDARPRPVTLNRTNTSRKSAGLAFYEIYTLVCGGLYYIWPTQSTVFPLQAQYV